MPTIYVRDVPEEVTTVLKRRAADEGKSLSAYVAGELTRLAARPLNQELVAKLRAFDRSQGPSTADIVRELEAGRR